MECASGASKKKKRKGGFMFTYIGNKMNEFKRNTSDVIHKKVFL